MRIEVWEDMGNWWRLARASGGPGRFLWTLREQERFAVKLGARAYVVVRS